MALNCPANCLLFQHKIYRFDLFGFNFSLVQPSLSIDEGSKVLRFCWRPGNHYYEPCKLPYFFSTSNFESIG
jgi:hypothetical protein